MIDLKKFDENLKKISEEIESEISKVDLDGEISYEFKLDEFEKSEINLQKNTQGIYIFYTKKNSLSSFEKKWGNKITKHSPKIIKDRIKYHQEYSKSKEWIPLYIGKSETVKSRINQHITKEKESTTSSMKLRERKKFDNDTFAVKIIPLETSHYGFIAHKIESILRKRINPIVGKE